VLFYWHCAAYYWLYAQAAATMWMYWWSISAPTWKAYADKVADYWKGVYSPFTSADANATAAAPAVPYPLSPWWPPNATTAKAKQAGATAAVAALVERPAKTAALDQTPFDQIPGFEMQNMTTVATMPR